MIEITPELAEICGIHAGDGYMRKRGNKIELELGGSLEEKDYYDNHVVPLFNNFFKLNLKARSYVKGTYGFITSNKELAMILNKLGFPFGKKSKIVEVPRLILESNDKILYSRFLRGLFDTDGGLYFSNRKTVNSYNKFKKTHNYYPTVRITTVSRKLIEGVCFILKELGIKYFVFDYQPKDLRDSYKYLVIISGKERLLKWMNLVKMKNSVKLSRYLIWKKFGFCFPHTTLQQRKDILSGKLDIYSISGSVV